MCSFAKDYSALVEREPHRHGGADSSKLVPLLWLACKACGNVSAGYTESGLSVVHILNSLTVQSVGESGPYTFRQIIDWLSSLYQWTKENV